MISLRLAFLLWRGYHYYWVGTSGYHYLKSAYQCYYLTHPVVRWCYKKIYKTEPSEWKIKEKKREYRILAELNQLQENRNIPMLNYKQKKEEDWIVVTT